MKTKYLSGEKDNIAATISLAASLLAEGEVVGFPTETVYGLGADATSEAAVAKVFAAKGRPSDNPLIVHIADREQLVDLVTEVPAYVEVLLDAFSPGPITYILPSKERVARNVTAGLGTVAVRIPSHPVALELLRACKLPIAAPSANVSGKPSPTTAQHVLDDLSGKIAAIVDGGSAMVGVESTVIDCTGAVPFVLRLGSITAEEIAAVVGDVKVLNVAGTEMDIPKSPGLKYKHYAPEVPLILVNGDVDRFAEVIRDLERGGQRVGALVSSTTAKKLRAVKVIDLGEGLDTIAKNLYDALRSVRKTDLDVVVCESFPLDGVGKAIMDRLTRAADDIV